LWNDSVRCAVAVLPSESGRSSRGRYGRDWQNDFESNLLVLPDAKLIDDH
jgi:hypothetical protein